MSDLEKQWDDLSTPPPPVADILRAAHAEEARRARRRQQVRRPLIVAAASVALIGAFVAGGQIGGAGGSRPSSDASPVAFQADLKPATSCADLLASYQDRALELVSKWGWEGDYGYRHPVGFSFSRLDGPVPVSAARVGTSSVTGTNVQEPDVDEADTVKTDGSRIVRLRGSTLFVDDTRGSSIVQRSKLPLPGFGRGELLLRGDRVVAIGTDTRSAKKRGSRVLTISLADDAAPTITSTVRYSARVVSARQHGDVVRLVMSSGLPDLPFVKPHGITVSGAEALATNRRLVRESTIADWLPTVTTDGTTRQLMACGDVALAPSGLPLDTTSITAFDVNEPADQRAIGLAGQAGIAYESSKHLYLAAPPRDWNQGVTQLFDFALDGVTTAHVASGEVEGTVLDRWSLDEVDDVLRVAVAPWDGADDASSVVTLRRSGEDLVEVGRLDGLGERDELKSVRWFDDLAVLVTFRQTDPLFTVDLSNPAKPHLLGSLKIPGYSAYLHPVGADRLLGVGYRGAKTQFSLFDLTDRSKVRLRAEQFAAGWRPLVDGETRAFTWLPDQRRAVTVLQRGNRAALATLTIGDGTLTASVKPLDAKVRPSQVRTIALADGRVALVAGSIVRIVP